MYLNIFEKDDAMRYSAEILNEEEVLQTTTCTPKDIYADIKGWTTAFEVAAVFLSDIGCEGLM